MAPTLIKQYIFLHVFDVKMQFDTSLIDNDNNNDPSVVIVWTDRIRAATEGYLQDVLVYDTLQSVQLYAVESQDDRLLLRGRRHLDEEVNKKKTERTFRYGGVAVFLGRAPTTEALQVQQRLALSQTITLQNWYQRQRYSMVGATVLLASFAEDGPAVVETPPPSSDPGALPSKTTEQEISLLIIGGAAGAALLALLLLIFAFCCVFRRCCHISSQRQRSNNKNRTVQRFHPHNQTFSLGGEEDDDDDDTVVSLPRRRSCMMMQIVDVDRQSDDRANFYTARSPLTLPRRLLAALPRVVDGTTEENSHSSSGVISTSYSLGSYLRPSPLQAVKAKYHPTRRILGSSAKLTSRHTKYPALPPPSPPATVVTVPTSITTPNGPPTQNTPTTTAGVDRNNNKTNIPSWLFNDDESSIQGPSDTSQASDVKTNDRVDQPPQPQHSRLLGPDTNDDDNSSNNNNFEDLIMDEELLLSLPGRGKSFLDSAESAKPPSGVVVTTPPQQEVSMMQSDDDDDDAATPPGGDVTPPQQKEVSMLQSDDFDDDDDRPSDESVNNAGIDDDQAEDDDVRTLSASREHNFNTKIETDLVAPQRTRKDRSPDQKTVHWPPQYLCR
jgi:hypothetical protein